MAIVLIFWRRSHPVFCLSLINPVHEMTIARWHFTASFVIHMTVSFTLRSRVIVDSMKLPKINDVPRRLRRRRRSANPSRQKSQSSLSIIGARPV